MNQINSLDTKAADQKSAAYHQKNERGGWPHFLARDVAGASPETRSSCYQCRLRTVFHLSDFPAFLKIGKNFNLGQPGRGRGRPRSGDRHAV
jgi:hypothetical protein